MQFVQGRVTAIDASYIMYNTVQMVQLFMYMALPYLCLSKDSMFDIKTIYPQPYRDAAPTIVYDFSVDRCEVISVNVFSKSRFFGTANGYPDVGSYKQCIHPYEDVVSDILRRRGYWVDCLFPVRLWFRYFAKIYPAAVSNAVFVDAGANIGSCSLSMLSYGIRTVALEPVPTNLLYLQRSIAFNKDKRANMFEKNLQLFPVAVGSSKGTAVIYVQEGNAGNSVLNSVTSVTAEGHSHAANFTVNVDTLDNILWPDASQDPPLIGVLKVDVQGYEAHALQGARRLLQASAIKFVQIELDRKALEVANSTVRNVVSLLQENGFSMHRFKCKISHEVVFSGESIVDINRIERFFSTSKEGAIDLIAVHKTIWSV